MTKAETNECESRRSEPPLRTYPLPTGDTTVRAVILADGEYPAPGSIAGEILRSAECVVCCDGAAGGYIARGGTPAAIVGDCDSLDKAVGERCADIIHRIVDPETNDLTKAFDFCLSQGLRDIIILGATGRREDHTLANIGLLSDYAATEGVLRVSMITGDGVFDSITEDSHFESFPGQQVSLFTVDPTLHVGSEGLLYPLPPRFRSWWCGSLNQSEGDVFTVYTIGKTIIFRVFEK